LTGEVLFVDDFGNLITNIPGDELPGAGDCAWFVAVGSRKVERFVPSYAHSPPGTLVALISSVGMLEIAVNQGSAAALLNAGPGTAVAVRQGSDAAQ
jgi:S-adenosylmethionine hydrolase